MKGSAFHGRVAGQWEDWGSKLRQIGGVAGWWEDWFSQIAARKDVESGETTFFVQSGAKIDKKIDNMKVLFEKILRKRGSLLRKHSVQNSFPKFRLRNPYTFGACFIRKVKGSDCDVSHGIKVKTMNLSFHQYVFIFQIKFRHVHYRLLRVKVNVFCFLCASGAGEGARTRGSDKGIGGGRSADVEGPGALGGCQVDAPLRIDGRVESAHRCSQPLTLRAHNTTSQLSGEGGN